MNRLLTVFASLAICAPAISFAQQNGSEDMVLWPKITTNHSVDCSSVESILGDLVHDGMSDEEKVLAVFNWVRRVLYHGDGPDELAFDFGAMVHSLGNGSCLRQTAPMAMLLERLGYEIRSWVHDTHHMIEVRYGGAWHCLDPHMNFWVRDRNGQIASVEQLREDSTLAWDAAQENRAAPGFLLCGDSPRWFTGGGEWTLDPGWPEITVRERLAPLRLRRGEFISYSWLPGELYYAGAWKFDYGTYHTCGPADLKDEVNRPLYEPHGAEVNNIQSYRHWAAGKMVYFPDLYSDNYQDGVVRMRNMSRLCPCFVMVPQDIRRKGEIVLELNCPYIITGGGFELQKGEESGPIAAEISLDGEQSWVPVEVEDSRDSTRASFVTPVEGHRGTYHLKLILDGTSSVSTVEVTTHFQHNPYALPYLVPGENQISVDAGQIGSLLRVDWTWAEGPDWNEEKSVTRTFAEPGKFSVQVGGSKYPRNVSLRFGVLP